MQTLEVLRRELGGRYAVEGELGRGGMATVYLARDRKHARRVAIKVLHRDVSQAVGSDRFLREIAIVARLQHPHILGLHESGEAAGFLYYVMPYVEGESLRDRLDHERQLPIDEAVRIALEVADALGYAHNLGLVHRDIKPDNILLSGGHAIIADFGIATALTVAAGEKLTQTGTTIGTPQYMSPEQAAGERVDGRGDLYALGCVLYEMLAGGPPFTGPTSQAILARHVVDPVPSLRTVRGTVSAGLEWVIDRALAKVPADRFASAAEFADALTHPERAPVGRADRRRLVAGLAAAGALAGLVLGLNVGGVRGRVAGSPSGFHSLAVLPVANLTGDTGQLYLAEAMTDQLITDLAQIGALRVIGRTSVQRYRGTAKTAQEIARELRVDAVLSASLQRAGDVIRVTAQLSSAPTGEARWARSYDGDLRDVLRLENEVSRAVAGEVRVAMTPQERRRLASQRTAIDPAAYGAYVKGRYFWNKRTGPDFQKAIGFFTQALDIDPTYAAAYSGLADSYIQMGYGSLGAPADLFPKAREAAVRATALDSLLAEPHAALGFYHLYYAWDWPAADREFRRALALNPNYATAHEWYGLYLTAMGQFDQARTEERRAEELDPLSAPIASTRGWVFHYSGLEDSAAMQLRKALALDSVNPIVHLYLGRVYQAEAQYDSAVVLYEATGRLRAWVPTVAAMGSVYGLAGRRADAIQVLRELERRSRHEYVTAYGVALVYAAIGDEDHAFVWLRQAVAERSHWLVWLLRDNRWQRLRGDARFQEIVRQVGLPG